MFDWAEWLRELLQEEKRRADDEALAQKLARAALEEEVEAQVQPSVISEPVPNVPERHIDIVAAEPMTDRKSTFQVEAIVQLLPCL